MAGPGPVIHVLRCTKQGVDASRGFCETAGGSGSRNFVPARARIKSGHDDLQLLHRRLSTTKSAQPRIWDSSLESRRYRVSRRIALSRPSRVSGNMRSSISCRTMPIEPVPDQ